MSQSSLRPGRSNGAIALGLFLLSCLTVMPALRWSFEPADATPRSRTYVLSRKDKLPAGMAKSDATAATRALEIVPSIKAWHYVAGLQADIVQFETVFWEPNDTDSLRERLARTETIEGARILEVGTGTGLVSLCCARLGAARVVATDINPAAYANAVYNAEHLGLGSSMDLRLVQPERPEPFSVVKDDEIFDLIISNPPWEDLKVEDVAARALYDPGFALLDGLLRDAPKHLTAKGELWLAFGAKTAIRRILDTAPQLGWSIEVADERSLDEQPEVFLPGMLLVLTRPRDNSP